MNVAATQPEPAPGPVPAWRAAQAVRAEQRFAELGLPRTQDEEWRYTSLSALDVAVQVIASPEVTLPTWVSELEGPRLVLVDGRFAPGLSRLESPPGLELGSVASLLRRNPTALEAHWSGLENRVEHGAEALNVARFEDGAYVHAQRRAALGAQLIHVVHVDTGGAFSATRSAIVVDADADLVVLETFLGHGTRSASCDVILGPGARLQHARLVESAGGHLGTVHVWQHDASRYAATVLTLAGGIGRTELRAHVGTEASCTVSALAVVGGRANADLVTVIRHAGDRGTSRQLVKNVLDGDSVGTFYGRVVVPPGTAKNDARQVTRTLLLSPRASAQARPQLEIYAEDEQCAHGATIAQLDEQQLFYLQARGIDPEAGRALLLTAFAAEVLEGLESAPVRAVLEARLSPRLRAGGFES